MQGSLYLDDNLILAQVTHCKENTRRVLDTRKEGKCVMYKGGNVIVTKKGVA